MVLVTIYQNGRRYYSAPVHHMPIPGEETTICSPSIQTEVKIYEDGDRYDTIFQKITEQEFELYKQDPKAFTSERVF